MRAKVIDQEKQDRWGRYPIIFKSAKMEEINEWLFNHYNGYKFAIVFDETKDEYEETQECYVYFLDAILSEAAEYANAKVVKQ